MHQKVLSCKTVALMILVLSVALINGQDDPSAASDQSTPCVGDACASGTPNPTGVTAGTTVAPTTVPATTFIPTTVPAKTTKSVKPRPSKRPASDEDYDSWETDDESDESQLESLDVWITFVHPWELNNNANNKGKGSGNSRNTKKGKKPTTTRVCFPVRHYQNYREFPMQSFPALVSIVPWLPIYYDKNTFQTIIFSPSGGIYIMPPLINFYGQRFSVAQLIGWGYASLVSTGAPPTPNVDVATFVQPTQPASNTNDQAPGSGLQFDEKRAQFTGGVKTQFRKFKPQYSSTLYEVADNKPEQRYTYKDA